jgi:hypothetical protein
MDLSKLHKDSELLRIYELFGGHVHKKYGDYQAYFAFHTLDRLYLDLDNKKDSKEIKKIVKPFLSGLTIHPYLMLEGLTDGQEKEITGLIFNDISKNLFPSKNFDKDIIRRVEYPSLDTKFMKNLLSTMTQERRDERFRNPKTARDLFLFFADKQHLGIVLDQLVSYAESYHRANDDGGGLDCDDE